MNLADMGFLCALIYTSNMRFKVFLLLAISFAPAIPVLACGAWTFQDLESERRYTFKVSGIELVDDSRPDPEFMQASRDIAFFSQGDRVRLKGDSLRYSRKVGKTDDGKRKFVTQSIGTFSKAGLLKLNTGGEYSVSFADNNEIIQVQDSNKKLVGRGQLTKEFTNCHDTRQTQLNRVAFFLIWRDMKIDPYTKQAENWWW